MFTLPNLDYSYDALEQNISEAIMKLHHQKHHQTYVDKLNAALIDYPKYQGIPIEDLIKSIDGLPDSIRTAVRNHGGGHYNHSLFWKCMSPAGGTDPEGQLMASLVEKYGSFGAFKEEFTNKALSLFGSGWVWLQPDMDIVASPNQDNPLMFGQPAPILGLDVWEHAYYLDYKNKRDDYINNWWNIVDWKFVENRYASAEKAV